MNSIKLDRKHMGLFWKLTVASLVYVLPIILADRDYNDDLSRSLWGTAGWKGDGRPMGEYLISLLCGGLPVIDLSPLFLLLAVVILSYFLVVYAQKNFKVFTYDNIKLLVLLFIITNPFAISNLSYKYDCLIMFTALGICFFVYSLDTGKMYIRFFCATAGGVLIMSLYQPVLGMCIVLSIAAVFLNMFGGGSRPQKILGEVVHLAGFGAGAVIYKAVIAPRFVSTTDWRHEASKMVSDISLDSLLTVKGNIERIFCYIFDYIKELPAFIKVVLASTIVLALMAGVINSLFSRNQEKILKIAEIVLIVVSPWIVFVGTFMPLVLLVSLDMRSRLFIAMGGFLFFIGILLMHSIKGNKSKIAVTILLLFCISYQYTFMYAYGNALKSQKEYEKYLVYHIAGDLETLAAGSGIETVTFDGKAPRSRQLQVMCNKHPFFEEIVPVYFGNNTWLGGVWLYSYMQGDVHIDNINEEDVKIISSKEPVISNSRYSCYVNERRAIIQFH